MPFGGLPDGAFVLISDLDGGALIVVDARARVEVKRLPLGVSSTFRYWGDDRTIYVHHGKGGRTWDIDFDDWMYLMDERVMLNKSVMSKFGVTLGEVTLAFDRCGDGVGPNGVGTLGYAGPSSHGSRRSVSCLTTA